MTVVSYCLLSCACAAACTSTPGCVVVPRIGSKGAADLCVSQYFNRLSKDQMAQFVQGLTLAEPAVVGSCDGACWMRQVGSVQGQAHMSAHCGSSI